MQPDEELNATTFQTYVYMVKMGKPVGPRDLMRGANLSSPSVAYRNLQKLLDLGLVVKDEYGNYVVKEKVNMKGYVWVGKTLLPSFAIFGFVFIGSFDLRDCNFGSSFDFKRPHSRIVLAFNSGDSCFCSYFSC